MQGKKCSDVMTRDLTCCLPKATVDLAAQSMKRHDIGSVPVVDGEETKRLLGIVTDRDLALKVVAAGLDARQTRVEAVMTRKLVTCGLQDDLQTALDAMSRSQLRRIPVVDSLGRLARHHRAGGYRDSPGTARGHRQGSRADFQIQEGRLIRLFETAQQAIWVSRSIG